MSGAHRAPEATLPVPNPSPELTVPVRNPDTDSHIWERVHVEGFRLPNVDNRPDVAIGFYENNGIGGYVQAEGVDREAEAQQLLNGLGSKLGDEFQPLWPRQSAEEIVAEVNDMAGRLNTPAMFAFVKPWEEADTTRAVVVSIGSGQVYWEREGVEDPAPQPLFIRETDAWLDGTEQALDKVQIKVLDLAPGDRLLTVSPAVEDNATEGLIDRDSIRRSFLESDIKTASEIVLGDVPVARDKVVLIEQIRSAPFTSWTRDEERAAGIAGEPPVAEDSAVRRIRYPDPLVVSPAVDPQPNTAPQIQPKRRNLIVANIKRYWADRRAKRQAQRSTAAAVAGGAVVGAAAASGGSGPARSYRRQRSDGDTYWNNAQRRANYLSDRRKWKNLGELTWYDRAGGWTTTGLASIAAIAAARKTKYHTNHFDDPIYRDRTIWDDELIYQDLERRRARRTGVVLGAAALAFIGGKYFHTDIMPSKLYILPGVNIGDGDGVDLWPTHGTTSAHAYSHGDMRDGGMGGWLLDDDTPTLPNPHIHAHVVPDQIPAPRPPYDLPSQTTVPQPNAGGGTGAPGGGTGGNGAATPPLPAMDIKSDSLYTSTQEGQIHLAGHGLTSELFDGNDAHEVFTNTAAHEHTTDLITYDQPHPGPDTYGDGKLSYAGPAHWQNDETAQFIHDEILRVFKKNHPTLLVFK
jgi:hypothetical protein